MSRLKSVSCGPSPMSSFIHLIYGVLSLNLIKTYTFITLGMFSFTGLTEAQVATLAEKASIYMTKDGRISMAGLNSGNIAYFAENVSKAVKGEL